MAKFWQVADVSPERWQVQRSLTEASALATVELIQQICSVSFDRANFVFRSVCTNASCVNLRDASAQELKEAGLTEKQAAKLLAAVELGKRALAMPLGVDTFSDPESAAACLSYELSTAMMEKGALLILDVRHRLLAKEIFAIGASSECLMDPKIIFERILRNRGSRFILAHNHPSGTPEPSPEDIDFTRSMLEASNVLDIQMLDHLIIVRDGYCSIRQETCLWDSYKMG